MDAKRKTFALLGGGMVVYLLSSTFVAMLLTHFCVIEQDLPSSSTNDSFIFDCSHVSFLIVWALTMIFSLAELFLLWGSLLEKRKAF